jgi:hypothetical protein
VLARGRFRVELDRPVVLAGATLQELADVAPVRVGQHLAVRRTRDVHRGEGGAPALDAPGVTATVPGEIDLQRDWGRADHRRTVRLRAWRGSPASVAGLPAETAGDA